MKRFTPRSKSFRCSKRSLLKWAAVFVSLYVPCTVSPAEGLGFVVVINSSEPVKLDKKSLRHIFMGGNLDNEYSAVHLPTGHPLRITFNTKVIGLTESRIQSYWAQLRFTGRGKPPLELENIKAVIEHLQAHPNVAAYLPDNIDLPGELTVIYP